MEKVRIDDIEPRAPPDENIPTGAMATSIGDVRPLSEALGTTGLSINYFELEPGESFAHSAHRHHNQEEIFYIMSGTATFETEDGDVTVDPGELLRIPPMTFQFGVNRGAETVTAITLGAPREYEGKNHYLIHCAECDDRTVQVFERFDEQNEFACRCTECDAETHRISY